MLVDLRGAWGVNFVRINFPKVNKISCAHTLLVAVVLF